MKWLITLLTFLIRIVVAIAVFLLIYRYLMPMLPEPFYTFAAVLLFLAAILWLLKLV